MKLTSTEFQRVFWELREIFESEKNHLIDMDNLIGDGDLGLTMADGFKAAYEAAIEEHETVGMLFYHVGLRMAQTVPSTMGTLMASGFLEVGKTMKSLRDMPIEELSVLLEAFYRGVQERGKARIGEKTFLDGWYPALLSLKETPISPNTIKQVFESAYQASCEGYKATELMVAKHGRAAIRGEQSLGYRDPGAYVATLVILGFQRGILSFINES